LIADDPFSELDRPHPSLYTRGSMRRIAIAVTLMATLAAVARVQGEDTATPTSTTVPASEATHTTTVEGTEPKLEGRWLLLASLGLAGGAKRIIPSVFDVRRVNGKLEIRERHIVLPAGQNEALRRANEELGGVWSPTDDDLAAIDATWETLTPENRGISQFTYQLTGRDAFDDDLKKEPTTKDALWVLRQAYIFLPGGSRPVNQANLLAPQKLEDGVYSGNYLAVAVAAAPFPVPIKFEGTFRLIPIGRASSLWTRLGDFFAGCNRR
jgi:hypothetical protein